MPNSSSATSIATWLRSSDDFSKAVLTASVTTGRPLRFCAGFILSGRRLLPLSRIAPDEPLLKALKPGMRFQCRLYQLERIADRKAFFDLQVLGKNRGPSCRSYSLILSI
ncbi:MAG TPA: hypothetical protein VG713_16530 [Pirellulales bacterium]|nr:hypothetical protein [Pirellulales bacterium]